MYMFLFDEEKLLAFGEQATTFDFEESGWVFALQTGASIMRTESVNSTLAESFKL